MTITKPGAQTSTDKLLWRLAGITVPAIILLGYLHNPAAFIPVLGSIYMANMSGFWHGTICGEAR